MKNICQGGNRIPIEALLNCSINEYLSSDESQLKKLKKVSFIKKIINKRALKRLSQKLIQDLEPYKTELQEKLNSKPDFSSPEMQKVKAIVTDFMLEVDKRKLVFDKSFLNFFMEQGYLEVAQKFITRAREEDSELKSEEIFQAIRNVWIMNSLQLFWGLPLKMTPSVYAYSMLYPYTDNFLDNPEVNIEEKVKFNERLYKVLNGENLTPTNFIEEQVFSLVGKIESEYSRDKFPEVFDSLSLIQEAQTESTKQDKDELLDYDKILPISFFKGGTSVLADAFLVKGNLNIKEMHFAFAYGSFLQLLDDLQDAVADKKDNHQTLFTIRNNNELIDTEVRSLISFIFKANATDESDTPIMCLMKEVITSCTLVMIMDAAGRNPELISHRLYKELESYSKVRLSFYKEFEDTIKSLIK
ncbi:hypothetical protein HMPREF1982_01840 [Clostridiales bacterium oral taxon 876 str. F0540]|nr:hypothetical protein HMPREF1982_01840 [Clostridiales bacterium oral taxon 876 str. F0540]